MSQRSVLSIHTGQCGVQMGKSVWELYALEHDISYDGTRYVPDPDVLGTNYDNFQTFFYETANGSYVPKALFIDSEPTVMDALRQGSVGELIHEDWMLNNNQDCRNVMGLAWYPTFCGEQFHDLVRSQTRRLREVCDSLSGCIYFHSSSGGTGPGFGCRVLQSMRESDPKSVNYAVCNSISPTISGNPLETYNNIAYLGLTRFDNLNMNMHVLYDNEALYRQCYKIYGSQFKPSYENCNQLVAMSTSSWTASLRFDGQLNVDLNEFETNLVPIPTLNLMFTSLAPLAMDEDKEIISTKEITLGAFTPEAQQCSVDCFAYANKWKEEEEEEVWPAAPWIENDEAEDNRKKIEDQGGQVKDTQWCISHKFLSSCFMYRGDLMPASVNRAMQKLNEKRRPEFVAWVPSGFKVGINSPPLRTPNDWFMSDISRSLTCIINNTVISEKLKYIVRNYQLTEKLEAYKLFTEIGGMEQGLLDSSRNGICNAIDQYNTCMSVKTEIDEVKAKLEGRPEEIGVY